MQPFKASHCKHHSLFAGNLHTVTIMRRPQAHQTTGIVTFSYCIYTCIMRTFSPLKSTFKFTMHIIRGLHCLVKKTQEDKSFAVTGV